MKRQLVMMATTTFFLATGAFGQGTGDQPSKGNAFFFAAPGILTEYNQAGVHFGVGGEGLLVGGLGAGVDIGVLTNFKAGAIGIFSPGLVYQFRPGSRTAPFVAGGYTLAFGGGTLNMIHFGGGVNHWFSERWGLKIEARDHMSPQYPRLNFLEFRVALTVR